MTAPAPQCQPITDTLCMLGNLPLQYADGPDYCTVTDATGGAFALTVQPDLMKLLEAHASAHATLTARVGELESEEYLVWSNQHRAWWRPNSCGYTTDIRSAGRYPRDEAISISGQSRDGWGKPSDIPDELAIPISAIPKNIRAVLQPKGAV